MVIGLFGGSFDPPHNGHLTIAQSFYTELALDRVIFIPAYIAPQKKRRAYASDADRLNMLGLALADHPYFSISDIELQRQGISYTLDTITYFQQQFPAARLFLLIGGDSFLDFHNWHQPDEILKRVQVVVAARPDCDLSQADPAYLPQIILLKNPLRAISSCIIRERIKNRQPIQSLVPPAVEQYIYQHRLYTS
jgi:nicotinate-nucleotide adenylyltransferase